MENSTSKSKSLQLVKRAKHEMCSFVLIKTFDMRFQSESWPGVLKLYGGCLLLV